MFPYYFRLVDLLYSSSLLFLDVYVLETLHVPQSRVYKLAAARLAPRVRPWHKAVYRPHDQAFRLAQWGAWCVSFGVGLFPFDGGEDAAVMPAPVYTRVDLFMRPMYARQRAAL